MNSLNSVNNPDFAEAFDLDLNNEFDLNVNSTMQFTDSIHINENPSFSFSHLFNPNNTPDFKRDEKPVSTEETIAQLEEQLKKYESLTSNDLNTHLLDNILLSYSNNSHFNDSALPLSNSQIQPSNNPPLIDFDHHLLTNNPLPDFNIQNKSLFLENHTNENHQLNSQLSKSLFPQSNHIDISTLLLNKTLHSDDKIAYSENSDFVSKNLDFLETKFIQENVDSIFEKIYSNNTKPIIDCLNSDLSSSTPNTSLQTPSKRPADSDSHPDFLEKNSKNHKPGKIDRSPQQKTNTLSTNDHIILDSSTYEPSPQPNVNLKVSLHSVRCDIDKAPISDIPSSFLINNCVYPKANLKKADYKGNRWEYESACNNYGWRLAFLNQEKLAGKRGLLQRAVDSYRNLMSGRKNRRISKQQKLMQPEYIVGSGPNGFLDYKNHNKNSNTDDPNAKTSDHISSQSENASAISTSSANQPLESSNSLISRKVVVTDRSDSRTQQFRKKHILPKLKDTSETLHASSATLPKMLLVEVFIRHRFDRIRIKADITSINQSSVSQEFIISHCVYPRALNVEKERYKDALGRWAFEVSCNEISWKLAWLNKPRLTGNRPFMQKCLDAYRWRLPHPPATVLECLKDTPQVFNDPQFLALWVPRWGRKQFLDRRFTNEDLFNNASMSKIPESLENLQSLEENNKLHTTTTTLNDTISAANTYNSSEIIHQEPELSHNSLLENPKETSPTIPNANETFTQNTAELTIPKDSSFNSIHKDETNSSIHDLSVNSQGLTTNTVQKESTIGEIDPLKEAEIANALVSAAQIINNISTSVHNHHPISLDPVNKIVSENTTIENPIVSSNLNVNQPGPNTTESSNSSSANITVFMPDNITKNIRQLLAFHRESSHTGPDEMSSTSNETALNQNGSENLESNKTDLVKDNSSLQSNTASTPLSLKTSNTFTPSASIIQSNVVHDLLQIGNISNNHASNRFSNSFSPNSAGMIQKNQASNSIPLSSSPLKSKRTQSDFIETDPTQNKTSQETPTSSNLQQSSSTSTHDNLSDLLEKLKHTLTNNPNYTSLDLNNTLNLVSSFSSSTTQPDLVVSQQKPTTINPSTSTPAVVLPQKAPERVKLAPRPVFTENSLKQKDLKPILMKTSSAQNLQILNPSNYPAMFLPAAVPPYSSFPHIQPQMQLSSAYSSGVNLDQLNNTSVQHHQSINGFNIAIAPNTRNPKLAPKPVVSSVPSSLKSGSNNINIKPRTQPLLAPNQNMGTSPSSLISVKSKNSSFDLNSSNIMQAPHLIPRVQPSSQVQNLSQPKTSSNIDISDSKNSHTELVHETNVDGLNPSLGQNEQLKDQSQPNPEQGYVDGTKSDFGNQRSELAKEAASLLADILRQLAVKSIQEHHTLKNNNFESTDSGDIDSMIQNNSLLGNTNQNENENKNTDEEDHSAKKPVLISEGIDSKGSEFSLHTPSNGNLLDTESSSVMKKRKRSAKSFNSPQTQPKDSDKTPILQDKNSNLSSSYSSDLRSIIIKTLSNLNSQPIEPKNRLIRKKQPILPSKPKDTTVKPTDSKLVPILPQGIDNKAQKNISAKQIQILPTPISAPFSAPTPILPSPGMISSMVPPTAITPIRSAHHLQPSLQIPVPSPFLTPNQISAINQMAVQHPTNPNMFVSPYPIQQVPLAPNITPIHNQHVFYQENADQQALISALVSKLPPTEVANVINGLSKRVVASGGPVLQQNPNFLAAANGANQMMISQMFNPLGQAAMKPQLSFLKPALPKVQPIGIDQFSIPASQIPLALDKKKKTGLKRTNSSVKMENKNKG
ncbi:hypothetical protein BB560_000825 [Smittium megazygosporum]|uniref:DUF8032 domain-containing protein n=1 Tax=Smittium megazygosporum TaxID=133381 RepID=A0A2T9ZJA2_9FUNG|nr:hypothetical protein BB560_000825 [Smittium megazygosporum]